MTQAALELIHSAKGSTWKNHKYIKKVNGRYIYPGQDPKTTPRRLATYVKKENTLSKSNTGTSGKPKRLATYVNKRKSPQIKTQSNSAAMRAYNANKAAIAKKTADKYSQKNKANTAPISNPYRKKSIKERVTDAINKIRNKGIKSVAKDAYSKVMSSLKKRMQSKTYSKLTSLQHSAKGSSWDKHKYIKRIDGAYYYPDSYENGRHLPNSNGNAKLHQSQQNQQQQAAGQQNLEAWEKALYDKFAQAFADNPGKYTNEMLTSASEEEFKGALKQFAGIDTDKLSPQQLAEMRKKFDAHYGKTTPASKSSSQTSKSSKSSSKSSSSKSSSSSSKQTSEKSSSGSKSKSKKKSKDEAGA